MKKQKLAIIRQLFVACQGGSDSKFIVRALEGKLRIGLAEKTVRLILYLLSISHKLIERNLLGSRLFVACDCTDRNECEWEEGVKGEDVGEIREWRGNS